MKIPSYYAGFLVHKKWLWFPYHEAAMVGRKVLEDGSREEYKLVPALLGGVFLAKVNPQGQVWDRCPDDVVRLDLEGGEVVDTAYPQEGLAFLYVEYPDKLLRLYAYAAENDKVVRLVGGSTDAFSDDGTYAHLGEDPAERMRSYVSTFLKGGGE